MKTVTSADGTVIGYTRHGDGPRVILVGGGLDDGTENAPLAEALAAHRAQLIRSQQREKESNPWESSRSRREG
jgi:hypothetical protein